MFKNLAKILLLGLFLSCSINAQNEYLPITAANGDTLGMKGLLGKLTVQMDSVLSCLKEPRIASDIGALCLPDGTGIVAWTDGLITPLNEFPSRDNPIPQPIEIGNCCCLEPNNFLTKNGVPLKKNGVAFLAPIKN